jgi:hypothetical protein
LVNITAIFAVTVDFPTPPFPEDMAMIFSIPGIGDPFIASLDLFDGTILKFTLIFAFS